MLSKIKKEMVHIFTPLFNAGSIFLLFSFSAPNWWVWSALVGSSLVLYVFDFLVVGEG